MADQELPSYSSLLEKSVRLFTTFTTALQRDFVAFFSFQIPSSSEKVLEDEGSSRDFAAEVEDFSKFSSSFEEATTTELPAEGSQEAAEGMNTAGELFDELESSSSSLSEMLDYTFKEYAMPTEGAVDKVHELELQGEGLESVTAEVVENLLLVKESFSKLSRSDQVVLADNVATLPDVLEGYYSFSFNLFELSQGLSSEDSLVQLYLLVASSIEGWVDVSQKVCKILVCNGMLLQNVNHLLHVATLPQTDTSEMLQSAAEADLGIIYNCARNYPLPGFYLSRFSWGKILCRWEHSSNAGIRVTCKLLGSILRQALLDEEQGLLDFTLSDLLSLLEALEEATKSEDAAAEAFGYKYTTLELLQILQGASIRATNLDIIAKPPLLVSLSRVIRSGHTTEMTASLMLLWSLLEKEDVKRDCKVFHGDLVEHLTVEMCKSKEYDLAVWSKGVILKLLDSIPEEPQDACELVAAWCAYALGRYDECERCCKQFIATSTETTSATRFAEVQILKAKSMYHMYTIQQRQLRMQQTFSTSSDFFIQHRDCYDNAKEVVKIFGQLRDSASGAIDPDCQRMLDFAMLDYCLETNRLKQLRRCFLCLQNRDISQHEVETASATASHDAAMLDEREVSTLGIIAHSKDSSYFEQAKEAKMNEVKMKLPSETMQPKRLQASHLVPHAIIKRLAKVVSPNPISKNVFFSVSESKDSMVSPLLRTPARCTITMLCRQCEHKLNVLGEEPFLPIFDKVYDSSLHGAEFLLDYGKELYHFSVGLIFRTLHPSLDDYINTDEVYQLLANCRKYLMQETTSGSLSASLDMPEVFLFVCPQNALEETDKSFNNFLALDSVSYISKFSLDTTLAELGTFESVLAHFFLVKLGIVCFVVKLGPSVTKQIDARFQINSQGGCYTVPSNCTRRTLLPVGLWTALHKLHETYKDDMQKVSTQATI